MAAAGESATVFLETSLGTRLVVSFPARATTVADLKRQVTAEHAACFPRAGPIAVTSLQVKQDGSLFHLTDSMVVQAAFHWVKGPWHILVEAHELRSHPLGCKDAKCGTNDAEENAGHLVAEEGSKQSMLPAAASHGGDDLVAEDPKQDMLPAVASRDGGNIVSSDGDSESQQMDQLDVEHVSGRLEDGNTLRGESSDLGLAEGDSDTQPTKLLDECSEADVHTLGPCEDGNNIPGESSELEFAAGDNGTEPTKQVDKSNEAVEHALGQREDGNIMDTESSELDLAAGDNDTQAMDQPDKSSEAVEHALGQREDGNTTPGESSELDFAAGDSGTQQMNQPEKSSEAVQHALGQREDGNTMPGESSELDSAAADSDAPSHQHDKSHECVEQASGQCKDGNISIPQKSSDLDVAADKENIPVGDQQKGITAEPRGNKRLREEDTNDESIFVNCDDNLSSLARPTLVAELSKKKSSTIEERNLNSDPLPYNSDDCSHGLEDKPSCVQKEPLAPIVCNGEKSKNGSDIPTCVESMEIDNSSDKEVKTHRGDKVESKIAEVYAGESSSKGTDATHHVGSMQEDRRRPASNYHYVDKGKYERATSSRSQQRVKCAKFL